MPCSLPPAQDAEHAALILKRLSFAILSGETDQYVQFLPDIQGWCNRPVETMQLP